MLYDRYSSKCRGCGERIFFAYADSGRQMVIHAPPVPNPTHPKVKPNVALEERTVENNRKYLHATVKSPSNEGQISLLDEEVLVYNYVDHHALCPRAEDFR